MGAAHQPFNLFSNYAFYVQHERMEVFFLKKKYVRSCVYSNRNSTWRTITLVLHHSFQAKWDGRQLLSLIPVVLTDAEFSCFLISASWIPRSCWLLDVSWPGVPFGGHHSALGHSDSEFKSPKSRLGSRLSGGAQVFPVSIQAMEYDCAFWVDVELPFLAVCSASRLPVSGRSAVPPDRR